jgi:hypothetical protein
MKEVGLWRKQEFARRNYLLRRREPSGSRRKARFIKLLVGRPRKGAEIEKTKN